MPTPFESATLNLKLYELRREPVLREARNWFLLDFHPETLADVMAAASSERNSSFRMVLSYWEMAASLVTSGAIDAGSFLAAHGEIFGTFAKIQPFLAEMRSSRGEAGMAEHLEKVVIDAPDALAIMARRRAALRAFYDLRQKSAKAAG